MDVGLVVVEDEEEQAVRRKIRREITIVRGLADMMNVVAANGDRTSYLFFIITYLIIEQTIQRAQQNDFWIAMNGQDNSKYLPGIV